MNGNPISLLLIRNYLGSDLCNLITGQHFQWVLRSYVGVAVGEYGLSSATNSTHRWLFSISTMACLKHSRSRMQMWSGLTTRPVQLSVALSSIEICCSPLTVMQRRSICDTGSTYTSVCFLQMILNRDRQVCHVTSQFGRSNLMSSVMRGPAICSVTLS
jgi:hypothetical protein